MDTYPSHTGYSLLWLPSPVKFWCWWLWLWWGASLYFGSCFRLLGNSFVQWDEGRRRCNCKKKVTLLVIVLLVPNNLAILKAHLGPWILTPKNSDWHKFPWKLNAIFVAYNESIEVGAVCSVGLGISPLTSFGIVGTWWSQKAKSVFANFFLVFLFPNDNAHFGSAEQLHNYREERHHIRSFKMTHFLKAGDEHIISITWLTVQWLQLGVCCSGCLNKRWDS